MFSWQIVNSSTNIEEVKKRAGNCKSDKFPCESIPKSLNTLWDAEPYTGHDLNLGSVFILIDTEMSKPLRILLLAHYGKYINVVSSASSMHRSDLFEGSVDDQSIDIQYGISFIANLRLIKRIISDLSEPEKGNHKLVAEIKVFLKYCKDILNHFKIKIPVNNKAISIGCVSPRWRALAVSCSKVDDVLKLEIDTNIIICEQLLRYTNDMMILNKKEIVDSVYNASNWGEYRIKIELLASRIQLETIYNQRKNHKRKEWSVICREIERKLK